LHQVDGARAVVLEVLKVLNTSVYEKVGTRWKLVHRHADPITTSRPPESMVGK